MKQKLTIKYPLILFVCLFLMGMSAHAQTNKNDETRSWDWAFENGEITMHWSGLGADPETKNEYFDCIEEWYGYVHDGYYKPYEYSSYTKAYDVLWKLIYETKKNQKETISYGLIEHNKHKRFRIMKSICYPKSRLP
ncbi:MAG: hypothetical protein OXG10_08075 [Candidatus Dadabacteria bacterium]|nr:hypothetical protein [Candidatus Dadabacteria bacterium]